MLSAACMGLAAAQVLGVGLLGAGGELVRGGEAGTDDHRLERGEPLVVVVPRRIVGAVLVFPRADGGDQALAKVLPLEVPVAGEREGDAEGGAFPFARELEGAVGPRRAVGRVHHAGDGEVLESRLHRCRSFLRGRWRGGRRAPTSAATMKTSADTLVVDRRSPVQL